MKFSVLQIACVLLLGSRAVLCGQTETAEKLLPGPRSVNAIGEDYARLVLALGRFDPDYVDAFYGPADWQKKAETEKKPLAAIREEATDLFSELSMLRLPIIELERLRVNALLRGLGSLEARVRIVQGAKLKFDEESKSLYDAVAPTLPEAQFEKILAELEQKIPGNGPLAQRFEEWRKPFIIPKSKLDAVFQLAIKECRARTLAQIKLPPNESFTVEYVTDKPWSGYNWYKGDYRSVIQVNTDLPTFIDRAIDLAAHEGYPGHHVYNALLEKNLVRDRGWQEFTVYPLFSPGSLIAEGSANFGKEVVFTRAERMKFEREVLWPAAGLDPKRLEEFYQVEEMTKALSYAGNEAARKLVNGEIDAKEAARWLQKYTLMDEKRAQQRVKFIERYRSYVINYNFGEDLVRNYIEKRGGTPDQPEKRWREFEALLSAPHLPSELRAATAAEAK